MSSQENEDHLLISCSFIMFKNSNIFVNLIDRMGPRSIFFIFYDYIMVMKGGEANNTCLIYLLHILCCCVTATTTTTAPGGSHHPHHHHHHFVVSF